jgi:hypothetical protein
MLTLHPQFFHGLLELTIGLVKRVLKHLACKRADCLLVGILEIIERMPDLRACLAGLLASLGHGHPPARFQPAATR